MIEDSISQSHQLFLAERCCGEYRSYFLLLLLLAGIMIAFFTLVGALFKD